MLYKKCKICDNIFGYYPSTESKKVYCSKECRERDCKTKYICPGCGKEHYINNCFLEDKYFKKKFCSDECYDKYILDNKKKRFLKHCTNCRKEFFSNKEKTISGFFFCSQECSKQYMKGKNAYGWKGGTFTVAGYKIVKKDGKYQYEHRIVMEKYLGRKLRPDEAVHHIDENKLNNDIANLKLMTKREHDRHHMQKRIEREKSSCGGLQQDFRIFSSGLHKRKNRSVEQGQKVRV